MVGVPVTARQAAKRSAPVSRYAAAVRRWWRGRQWPAIGPTAARQRGVCPGDVRRRSRRSRSRVGRCASSARSCNRRCCRCPTPGSASRSAAPSLASVSAISARGPWCRPWWSRREHVLAVAVFRRPWARMWRPSPSRSTTRHRSWVAPVLRMTTSSRGPCVAGARATTAQRMRVGLAELPGPPADRLVGADHAALGRRLLHVAVAEGAAAGAPHRMRTDRRRAVLATNPSAAATRRAGGHGAVRPAPARRAPARHGFAARRAVAPASLARCPGADAPGCSTRRPHAAPDEGAARRGPARGRGTRDARMGVRRVRIPLAAASCSECAPYLRSLSRLRKRGPVSNGVAARSCRATHASVGWRVTPTWTTRREPSAMTKNAWSGRDSRSVTGRTSQARIAAAWLRRRVVHVCPRGRGVPRPRREDRMVRFAARMPSVPRSPRIRRRRGRALDAATQHEELLAQEGILGEQLRPAAQQAAPGARRVHHRCGPRPENAAAGVPEAGDASGQPTTEPAHGHHQIAAPLLRPPTHEARGRTSQARFSPRDRPPRIGDFEQMANSDES